MRRHRILTYIALVLTTALLLSLTACDGTTFGSSVPRLRVNIRLDLRQSSFVTFTPENTYAYVTATRKGFYLNGEYAAPALDTDYFGYGGVVIYVNMLGGYDAYDMACPYCASRGYAHTCKVNSMSAVCPVCGEEYQLWSGTGIPTKGITREPLLRLPLTVTDNYIIVRQ